MSTTKPLGRLRAFMLANAMLITFFVSLSASIAIAVVIGHYTVGFAEHHLLHHTVTKYGPYYDIPVSVLMFVVILWYERPIRRHIKSLRHAGALPPADDRLARRRLLNEPFFLVGLNLVSWIGAALVYSQLARGVVLQPETATELIINNLLTAVIGMLATFFFLQYCLQRFLVPAVFPHGGLSRVRGAVRIKLSTRLAALIAAAALAPLFIIGVTLYGAERQRLYGVHPEAVLDKLSVTLTIELVLFSLLAVALTLLVAVNLARPFRDIIAVLHKIKNGRYDRRVRVVTNDEIGYTGDAINEMASGLEERERMRQSLSLAREVQQSLLPSASPQVPGLEISGKSLYCDETGGDYYDYMQLERNGSRRLAAVIGDVSGHGVSAALLMTSIRSLLRLRAFLPGNLDEIVGHLNRQISHDTEETGHFVTLFYLEVDLDTRCIQWVRAGHEPAYLYRPQKDRFKILESRGAALGMEPTSEFRTKTISARHGEILLLTTDGIFETRSGQEMFGRQRFMEVVRRHHHLNAAGIRDAVLEAVEDFRGPAPQEDDVTLVVMKFD